MKNIVAINYLSILYSIVVGLVAYIFFRNYYIWTILGAVTALFNYSLVVRFTKNKAHRDVVYLLIAFRTIVYLIVLAFMYFLLSDDTMILMYSYIFFVVGAINTKMGVFIFHLPIPYFKKIRAEADDAKEDGMDATSNS